MLRLLPVGLLRLRLLPGAGPSSLLLGRALGLPRLLTLLRGTSLYGFFLGGPMRPGLTPLRRALRLVPVLARLLPTLRRFALRLPLDIGP